LPVQRVSKRVMQGHLSMVKHNSTAMLWAIKACLL
jgi:hypothetical protein